MVEVDMLLEVSVAVLQEVSVAFLELRVLLVLLFVELVKVSVEE